MALIPPGFLDCVCALGINNGEQFFTTATGFLVGRFAEKKGEQMFYRVYLATNRHVFHGQKTLWARFNPPVGNPGRIYDMKLVDDFGNPLWTSHPNPEVDVAVIPINVTLLEEHGIQYKYFQLDQNVMTRATAEKEGLSEGDGIFVLGFPMGISGQSRNYVVVRQGVLARVRDWIQVGEGTLLIDSMVLPGNSGGPVLTRPEINKITGTQAISRSALIGIVSGYIPYTDEAVSKQTGKTRVAFEENSGLAVVVTSDKILETVEIAFKKQLVELEKESKTREAEIRPALLKPKT